MGDVANVKLIKEMMGHPQNFNIYLGILHSFFTFKISYEEMKCRVENLLTPKEVKMHNDLIRTIMKKIRIGPHLPAPYSSEVGPNPSQKDKAKGKATDESLLPKTKKARYQPGTAIMITYVPRITPELADTFSICASLRAFPDVRYMYGTLLVLASFEDLEVVPEICAIYVTIAVKEFIKNILLGIFSKRKANSLHNSFFHVASHRDSPFQTSSTLPFSSATIINRLMFKPEQPVSKMQSHIHLDKGEATKTLRTHSQSHVFAPVSVHELYDTIVTETEAIPIEGIRIHALEYCMVKIQGSNF